MATISPGTLPTVQIYNTFTSTQTFYNGSTAIAVHVSSVTIYAFNTSYLTYIVGSSSGTNYGSSVTISGYYALDEFNQVSFNYRSTLANSSVNTVASFSALSSISYYSLWKYTADQRSTTSIQVVIATDAGTFTLTAPQTVVNNWDYDKNQLSTYVKKSTVNKGSH